MVGAALGNRGGDKDIMENVVPGDPRRGAEV